MAKIFLTWELGGGLGHLMNLRPIAAGLVERGHEVVLAAKDLSRVRRVIDCSKITLVAAPWNTSGQVAVPMVVTFADLLLNVGFADVEALKAHVAAWRSLFSAFKPNLIICDHSPTALLAARGMSLRVATVGTGFFCPVNQTPLGMLREVPAESHPEIQERELRLLHNMNSAISSDIELESVAQLYHNEQSVHLLLTFQELDHFPDRGPAKYFGAYPFGMPGAPFVRPPGRDPCLFGYLKPFPALDEFLAKLSNAKINSLIYVDGLTCADREKYTSERLKIAERPVDMRQAAEQCDVGIANANHGTCVAMLLRGKPLVLVPPYLEQELLASAIERFGAGLSTSPNDANGIARALNLVLSRRQFRHMACIFAERYRRRYSQIDLLAECEQLAS